MTLNPLAAPAWKLATVAVGIACAILIALLTYAGIENRGLAAARTELASRINDPKTGYVVRLAQAQTNVETLKVALETQRASFQTESARQNVALRASEERLAVAQAQTRTMETKLARFLATAPQGATLEERVRDIDQRILSELDQ